MATPNDVNLVTPDPTNDYCLASGISGDQQKWNPTVILVGAGVTSIGSGAIITAAERMAITTNTTHATGSGSDHSDVAANTVKLGTITSVGSGAIITALERTSLTTSTAHIAGSGLDHSQVATNTTKLATITSVGSGDIITTAERTQVPSSPSAGQVNYVWGAVSAGTAAWIAQPASEDPNDRGWYADLATLQAASPLDPAETAGDFAQLINSGSDATLAVWDADAGPAAWIEIGVGAVTSVDFGGGGGAQVGVISIDSDDIGEGATNLWLTVAERAAVAAGTTHETSTGADHTYIDQDVTSGSSPVFAVTNMTGSAAGLDSDATTHAASDGASHTFLDQDVTISAAPILAVTNFTGTLAGIDSAATAHAASDGASHDFINQSVIAGAAPTFAGTNFTGIPALAINETLSAPLVWEFDDDVSDDDPTAGKFSGDNAAITAWNQINIAATSDDSLLVSAILEAMRNGDFLTIRQRGLASTKSAVFSITSTPTNQGTYYTIPVTWVTSSGKPADGSKCEVVLQSVSQTEQTIYDTIAALKAVTSGVANGDMFVVKGVGDFFQYNSAVSTYDEVISYEATGLGVGAYVRLASGGITPEQYGAVGDDVTDDTAAIEAAIAAASGTGKQVLMNGTYYVASTIDALLTTDVTILGSGTVRTDADSNLLNITGDSVVPPTVGNIRIEGLEFRGNNTGTQQHAINAQKIKGLSIINCDFKSFSSTNGGVVEVNECLDVIISQNHIADCTGSNHSGFRVISTSKCVITSNRVECDGTIANGINIATVGAGPHHMSVTSNVVTDATKHGAIVGYSVDTKGVQSVVANNIFHNCGSTGIYAVGSDGSGRLVISGNHISNCAGTGGGVGDAGIYVNTEFPVSITGNSIHDHGIDEDGNDRGAGAVYSISLSSCGAVNVTGNVMDGGRWYHMGINSSGAGEKYASKVNVSSNEFRGAKVGIWLRSEHTADFDVSVHGNQFFLDYDSRFSGIYIDNSAGTPGSNNVLVEGNAFRGVNHWDTMIGTQNGAGNGTTFTFTSQPEFLTDDALIGITIQNTTDGSSATITANDVSAGTITCGGLTGGTDDTFEAGDAVTFRLANYVAGVRLATGGVWHGRIADNFCSDCDVFFYESGANSLDKYIGTDMRVVSNHCRDIAQIAYFMSAVANRGHIIEDPSFSGTIGSTGFNGRSIAGRKESDGADTFTLYRDSAPTEGAFRVGDKVRYETVVPGGFIGLVCTTGGIPGTWKTYGAVSA